jgi:putative endonuclease
MIEKTYFVYLLTNKYSNVIYTGVTNDLSRRIYEHKEKLQPGFTQQYKVDRLVYYELHSDISEAILREKVIKGWSRTKKNLLIRRDLIPHGKICMKNYIECFSKLK